MPGYLKTVFFLKTGKKRKKFFIKKTILLTTVLYLVITSCHTDTDKPSSRRTDSENTANKTLLYKASALAENYFNKMKKIHAEQDKLQKKAMAAMQKQDAGTLEKLEKNTADLRCIVIKQINF